MLVISDIDGTLLDRGGEETDACVHLFSTLREAGVTYGFATSRPLESLTRILPVSVQGAAFAVCSEGGITAQRNEKEEWSVVRRCTLESSAAILARILQDAASEASVFAFGDDLAGFRVAVRAAQNHEEAIRSILSTRERLDLETILPIEDGVLSIGVLSSREASLLMRSRLETPDAASSEALIIRVYEEVRVAASPALWWCDVMPADADKAVSCAWLLCQEALSLSTARGGIILLADGENDIRLAELAETTYCPPWANSLLKQRATVIKSVANCEQFVRAVAAELMRRVEA